MSDTKHIGDEKETEVSGDDDAGKGTVWKSPTGAAVIGGILTLLTAIVSNLIDGCNNRALERAKFQSELIQHAIENAKDEKAAAVNLNFLCEAGLISEYDQVSRLLKEGAKPGYKTQLPSAKTYRGSP